MHNKILNNGIEMPAIGFGTFHLSGQECIDAVYEAIKAGYRLIDTAEGYANEAEVGIGIAKAIADGLVKRKDLFITTKLSVHHPIGYEETLKSFNESLKKLNLDYLDLYLIHYPNAMADDSWKRLNAETWKAMEELNSRGLLKSLGVSNFMPYHLDELLKTAKIKPAVNQIELSPTWQQREAVAYCQKQGIVLQAWQPIAPISREWVQKKDFIQEMPKKYNRSLAQIFLNWSVLKGYVPLCRTVRPERMVENLQCFDFKLDEADVNLLDSLQCSTTICPDISHHLWSLHEQVYNKKYIKTEVYRLFNLLPLFKMTYDGKAKHKLFLFNFIPLLKKKTKSDKYEKLYLFGFLPIGRSRKYWDQIIKIRYIPDYSKKSDEIKLPKWNVLKDRFVEAVVTRAKFWCEKYYKMPFFRTYLMLRYYLTRKISIPSLDVHITTFCSLKCRNCSHHIPYYQDKNKKMMSVEEFKSNVDTILKNVDIVYNMNILGGEPLMNKNIGKILEYAQSKKQIKALRIHTNGTILPDDDLLKLISKLKKVSFYLSNYSGNPSIKTLKNDEIVAKLKEFKIKYYIAPNDYFWSLVPTVNLQQHISDEQNVMQYMRCSFKYCPCLSGGKIYPCGLARYIADSGYKLKEGDCIDLSHDDLRKEFISFYKRNAFEICKCCDFTAYGSPIMPAIQLEKE